MADLQLLHLVARTTSGARPFLHRRACADLWNRIARNFDVVALVLMPDHVHLLTQIELSGVNYLGRPASIILAG